jgi:predicted phage terminase large subunit-like protein
MKIDKSHTNYSDEFYTYVHSINEIKLTIEKLYDGETKRGISKIYFDAERHYKLLALLRDGLQSVRKINDFEASRLAIYIAIPLAERYLTRIQKLSETGDSKKYAKYFDSLNIYWDMVAVGARYSLNYFIEYMFHNKSKKPYQFRKQILSSAVFYVGRGFLERLKIGIDFRDNVAAPNLVLFSTFPSSGKTLIANYAMAWIKCLAMIKIRGGGMLRIGNEEGNVNKNSQAIKDIILDETIIDVFPEMDELRDDKGKYKPFDKDSIDEWFLKEDKEEPKSAVFRTAGSATNGIRINLGLVIDDPSRGMVDRKNVDTHQRIIASYNGDWRSRFDNEDDSFVFALGTRFNNFDVFSAIQDTAEKKGLYKDENFENTYKTKDGKTVIINIDCEKDDGSGSSRYPELISDSTLEDKRNSMSKQEYYCVYRQKPIPEEGLDFDYSLLNTYDKKYEDEQLDTFAYASCDPTRKTGQDYLSVPIFKAVIDKKDKNFGKYALIDVIFIQKSVKDEQTFQKIIEKIVTNGIKKLYLEINTDTSLGQRIQDHLQSIGYNILVIKEIYSTQKKSERIADQTSSIHRNMVFPREGMYPKYTEIGHFMEQLTMYSSSSANKHDDAADSVATFSREHIDTTKIKNTIKFNSKSLR